MNTFSFADRKNNLKAFQEEVFDLVIIGGGINGAGVARDAAMRGMKVALVEAHDFASGTSSKSSKLVHGGLRYLENLEFHLVFEALSERQKLFSMAPHLVHPLRFMIPLYQGGSVGMFKMGLGMWLYDVLSLFQAPELHESLSKSESQRRLPFLQVEGLLGSYIYSDAYMDDDRLVHETLRSANYFGAVCANYVKATGVAFNSKGKVKAIEVKDQLSNLEFKIQGRHFISTVGPWTDEVGSSFFKEWKKVLRPTKGVHLTFEKSRIPLKSAVVMAAEKRIVFGIPRHEMVIVGTTDTDFNGHPEDVRAEVEDVTYLLGVVDKYFPGVKLKASDIVASYAGVRPLVQDGAAIEGKTSREHSIFTEPHGVTFVAGGKYTTYRLIAKQTIEHCLKLFPMEDRVRFGRCQTDSPINPLITEESFFDLARVQHQLAELTSMRPEELVWLSERHGPEAVKMIKEYGSDSSYIEIEARHAIHNTMCLSLLDFFARRVPLILSQKDHGLNKLDQVIRVFRAELGLSEPEISQQKLALQKYLESELRWQHEIKN